MSNPLFQLHAEVLDAATAEVALWRGQEGLGPAPPRNRGADASCSRRT